MTVEAADYIDGLVSTSPVNSDDASEGAAHLRLIKAALKATFPNIDGAVTATQALINGFDDRITDLEDGRLKTDGTGGMLANLDMTNHKIVNLQAATNPGDAVSYGWITDLFTSRVSTGSDGYVRIPLTGVMIAWGTVTHPDPGVIQATFPLQFSGTPWAIVAFPQTTATSSFATVTSFNTSVVNMNKYTASGGEATGPISYIAIGPKS